MTERKKRIIIITVCCLLCAAAAIGIAYRFGGNAEIPSGSLSDTQPDENDPTVDIDDSGTDVKPNVRPSLNTQALKPDTNDPGQGAVSTGTEQTIQADPVKPQAPEKPAAPQRSRDASARRPQSGGCPAGGAQDGGRGPAHIRGAAHNYPHPPAEHAGRLRRRRDLRAGLRIHPEQRRGYGNAGQFNL